MLNRLTLGRTSLGALAFAGLVLLGACSTSKSSHNDRGFERERAAEVFSTAFEGVQSFWISDPDVAGMALRGMNGLADLDVSVAVVRDDAAVRLHYNGRGIAEFPAPAADDVPRWSMLSAAVVDSARIVSPSLAAAMPETLYEVVLDAALSGLDRFSRYATAREASEHRAQRQGYSAIGLSLSRSGQAIVVREVFEATPAAQSGIRVGDQVVEIDGDPVGNEPVSIIAERLRGRAGSSISMKLTRPGQVLNVSIRRENVIEQTVYFRPIGAVGVARVRGFNEHTAGSLRSHILAALEGGSPIRGLIVDLRGNRGGVLKESVALADLFIAKGRILETRGRHPRARKVFEAETPDVADGLPIVVLIDHGSASASEVVAAALQDSGRAIVLGSRSYGKGTVQMIIRLPNDGEMTITWAQMYAPSGYGLMDFGVVPTICTAEVAADAQALRTRIKSGELSNADLGRQRRIVATLDASARAAFLERCPDRPRNDAAGDDELRLALSLLADPNLFREAFEASLIAMGDAVAK